MLLKYNVFGKKKGVYIFDLFKFYFVFFIILVNKFYICRNFVFVGF